MATSSGESPPTEDLPPRRDVVAQDEAEEGIFADSPESAESTRTPGPSAGHRHPNAEESGIPTKNDESTFAVVEDDEAGRGGPGSSEQRAGSLSGGTGLTFSLNNAVVSTDTVAAGSTIGSTRIIPVGMPGKGQFVPGELCQGPQCHGAMSNTFGVRFRPTISVADDGMVYIADLQAFNSMQR